MTARKRKIIYALSLFTAVILSVLLSVMFQTAYLQSKLIRAKGLVLEQHRQLEEICKDEQLRLESICVFPGEAPEENVMALSKKIDTYFQDCSSYLGMLGQFPKADGIVVAFGAQGNEMSLSQASVLVTEAALRQTGLYPMLDKAVMCRSYTTQDEVPVYLHKTLAGSAVPGDKLRLTYHFYDDSTPPRQQTYEINCVIQQVMEDTNYNLAEISAAGIDFSLHKWLLAIPELSKPNGKPLAVSQRPETRLLVIQGDNADIIEKNINRPQELNVFESIEESPNITNQANLAAATFGESLMLCATACFGLFACLGLCVCLANIYVNYLKKAYEFRHIFDFFKKMWPHPALFLAVFFELNSGVTLYNQGGTGSGILVQLNEIPRLTTALAALGAVLLVYTVTGLLYYGKKRAEMHALEEQEG